MFCTGQPSRLSLLRFPQQLLSRVIFCVLHGELLLLLLTGEYPATFSPAALSRPFSCNGMEKKVTVQRLRSGGSAQQRIYILSQLMLDMTL